jgi:hypothetical protein
MTDRKEPETKDTQVTDRTRVSSGKLLIPPAHRTRAARATFLMQLESSVPA